MKGKIKYVIFWHHYKFLKWLTISQSTFLFSAMYSLCRAAIFSKSYFWEFKVRLRQQAVGLGRSWCAGEEDVGGKEGAK